MTMPSRVPDDTTGRHRSALADKLARWSAQPVRALNRRVVIWTALTMVLILMLSRGQPDQAASVRGICLIGMGAHGALHFVLRGVLERLAASGMAEAGLALRAYLAPERITSLDLAFAWASLGAAVSLYWAAVGHAAGIAG